MGLTIDPQTMEPAAPVAVAVIGTGNGAALLGGIATTPGRQPNLVVTVIGPVTAVAVRFVYTFGGQLVGLLSAAMTPAGAKVLYTSDFYTLVLTCASLSLPWAVLAGFKDIITIFKGLEGKYPLLTGNV